MARKKPKAAAAQAAPQAQAEGQPVPETQDGPVVIQLVGLMNGQPHPLDGRYVKSYHPGPASMPLGQCLLLTTRHAAQAKFYASHAEAHAEWTRIDPRQPTRPNDGKPNRPLTAWNILITRASEAAAVAARFNGNRKA